MGMTRYPLAQAFMSRDGNLGGKDAFVQNGYVDKYEDKRYVCKRPGTTTFFNLGVSGTVQGAKYYNGFVYEVINDVLYRTTGITNSGSSGTLFDVQPTPGWASRVGGGQALVYQDRLWIMGAGLNGVAAPTGDVWSSQDGRTWALITAGAGAGRSNHRACVFNGAMWMLGGINTAGVAVGDVITSTDGATWTQVVGLAPWGPRQDFCLVVANNAMYVFGGFSNAAASTPLNDVWSSPDGLNWTQICASAPWSGRGGSGFAFYNNLIFMVGGATGATAVTATNETWASPDGINWNQETAGSFVTARYNLACVVYNNKLWAIGGTSVAANQLTDVYSTTTGASWTQVTATPGWALRERPMVAVFNASTTSSLYRYPTIYVMGGDFKVLGHTSGYQDVWAGRLDISTSASYPLLPSIAGLPYSFETFLDGAQLLIKNPSNLWVLDSGTLTKVVDPNYPPRTVPGIVVLNSFAYVCTPEGELHACGLEQALSWPSLQFTHADYEDDPAVRIAKYLNYVVVFGTYTMQFFYDAGNPPPGIPLSPYIGANLRVGNAFAQTVQNASNTLVWVGQTKERGWGVYVLDGMSPVKVSTTWVDRALNVALNSGVTAWVQNSDGHTFYVLNFVGVGFALVYDMAEKHWSIWTSQLGNLPYAYALSTLNFGGDLLVGSGPYAGFLFSTSSQAYDDAGLPFTLMVQTDKLDAGTLKRKFWGPLEVVADQTPATAYLSWSDNDYQSFNLPVPLDLSLRLPRRNRMGSSRRRAFRLAQTDSNPARWESLEINVDGSE